MTANWRLPALPEPPDFSLRMPALTAPFQAQIEPLAGCPQDPIFHAEGDVLIHTHGVVRAMAEDEEWRAIASPSERSVLLCAALLHDIGKPQATRLEDGRLRTRGHAGRGASMSRRLLYRGQGLDGHLPSLEQREQVVALVRHHGIALAFLKQPAPERQVIRAATLIPGRWLALLGRADVLGRESDDRQELLERVELFVELCRELGCLAGPRQFPSGEARHRYLDGGLSHPDVPLPEPTGSRVSLMCGLPGAGKDRWISQHGRGRSVVSLDVLRQRMGVKPGDNQGRVAQAARAEARSLLARQEPFIWNATNTTRSMRDRLMRLFRAYGAHVTMVYVEAPYQELLRRNRARAGERVPDQVLERLVDGLQPPDPWEANALVQYCSDC